MPDLAAIRRVLAAATPGPWHHHDSCMDEQVRTSADPNTDDIRVATCENHLGHDRAPQDAALIASARTWLPELVAEVERQAAEIASLRAELARLREEPPSGWGGDPTM